MKTKLKAVSSRREASDKIINHAGFRKKKKMPTTYVVATKKKSPPAIQKSFENLRNVLPIPIDHFF